MALQFPDDLLGVSVTVLQLLQKLTTVEIVILADTSYGRWSVCRLPLTWTKFCTFPFTGFTAAKKLHNTTKKHSLDVALITFGTFIMHMNFVGLAVNYLQFPIIVCFSGTVMVAYPVSY